MIPILPITPAPAPRSGKAGGAIIGLVLTLLILFVIVYYSRSLFVPTPAGPQTPVNGAQKAVCQSNITIMRNAVIQARLAPGAAVTTYTLKRQGSLLTCPEGGSYRVIGGEIYCSKHFPPPPRPLSPPSHN